MVLVGLSRKEAVFFVYPDGALAKSARCAPSSPHLRPSACHPLAANIFSFVTCSLRAMFGVLQAGGPHPASPSGKDNANIVFGIQT